MMSTESHTVDNAAHVSREGLTFAQAEGGEPLPTQLELKQISPELSAVLWAFVHDSIDRSFTYSRAYGGGPWLSDPWKTILRVWWILRLHKNVDELPDANGFMAIVKSRLTSRDYVQIFDFLQFVLQRPECPQGFDKTIEMALVRSRASYRVLGNLIVPISSEEQAVALRRDLAIAASSTSKGPTTHLRSASISLSAGKWAEAVRESMHAVEAAAKSVEPTANTLGPALKRLESSIGLKPALSRAYGALYGYASDEQGIRHSLVLGDVADVTESEAMFMFGACAAFVGYVLSVSEGKR
jgi:hypothetical protein